MSVEERLKKIILLRYRTVKEFSEVIGLAYSTVDTILRRGINKASINNVITICNELGISVDKLAQGRIVSVENSGNWKRRIEVSDLLELIRLNPSTCGTLTINGNDLTEEDFQTLETAVSVALSIIERKKTDTAKKP